MKCLDTTFLIDLLRNDPEAVKMAEELDKTGPHATTAINIFELVYGIHRGRRVDKRTRLGQAKRLFDRLVPLTLSYEAAVTAGEVLGELAGKGKEVSVLDGLIASIAIRHGCKVIVTRNVEHFDNIPGIRVETY